MRFAGSIRSISSVLLAALVVACSDETTGSDPSSPATDRLTVQLSTQRDSLLLGTSKSYSATVVNQYNQIRNTPVFWSSSNAAVLSVTSDGLVTALGQGSAEIVAAISGSADTLAVSVHGLPGVLHIYPEAARVPIGDEIQVVAETGSMMASGAQPIFWTSSDTAVATVSPNGLVSTVGEGRVEIFAELGGSLAKAGVDVFTPTIASLTISPAVSSVPTGESVKLSVTARSTSGRKIGGKLDVVWETSDTTIATVDAMGRVQGKARGFVTVRASVGDKSATGTVNVTFAAVASVVATLPDSSLLEGQTVTAAVVIRDAGGQLISGVPVSWQSSNPTVATVDASGKVNALSPGSATISAISGGKIGSVPLTVAKGSAASISILPSAPAVLVGKTAQLSASVLDQNGNPISGSASWSSSNASVATISSSGLLTGVAAGVANITASSGSYSATVQATVTNVSIASLVISPSTTTVAVGSTAALVATARDASGNLLSGRILTWTSSSPSVASVTSTGTVTGIQPGTATITVAAEGKTAVASVSVSSPTPSAVASIDVKANASVLNVGQSTQAVATLRDSSGTVLQGYPITWKTLDATIATVSSTGLITALSGGSVAIIATSGGVSGSLAVTVNTPEAAAVATVSVSLSPSNIPGGQTSQATVVLKDAQGQILTDRTVAYSSSNVTVATVASSGTVSGISSGEAGIIATAEGKSGKSFLVVSSGTPTVARVVVSAPATTLYAGGGTQATAVAYDAGGAVLSTTFAWSSSNPAVVAVSSSGMLTAVSSGSATITAASSNGTSGTLGILVSSSAPAPLATVSVTLGSASIDSGQTTQVSAVGRDANGSSISGLTFSYSSSNTAVATVSSSGKVTAMAPGSATISATTGGKSGSAGLTVTRPAAPPTSTPPASAAAALAKIGPTVTPAEATALGGGYARYDALWAKWEPTRFTADGTAWAANYYDRAQIYYAQWLRTGQSIYRQRADAMALDYRRNYLHANNYQTSPHWSQLDGVALHFWMTGDDSSRIAVGKAAWNLAGSAQWPRTGPYTDARQQARALIGMLLAWQTNAPNAPTGGWAQALDAGLNAILPQQSADGAWRYPANTCDLSLNYMGAMLADALIRVYTQYRADPRIPGAVQKTADFLWTQWRSKDAVPSFNYYEAVCSNQHGTGGPTATPDLTGLYVSMYAWVAAQDPTYRAKSDAVFAATMDGMYPQGAKQFNQAFAFGWRAMGYLP